MRLAAALALAAAVAAPQTQAPRVAAPPESFFQLVRESDRDAARRFYAKYVDVGGMPVAASAEVADLALVRTHEIVSHLLAGRPDVLQAMVRNGMYLIVIGKDQVYTDMPEYRNHPNPAYQNERVRGTGGKPTSFGEENLLSLPLDRYDDESIAVHEFCHTIDGALRSMDPTWTRRRDAAFQNARAKGLWENTYAGSSPGEYWGEICQSYFDCNRVNNWNHGPVGTRAELRGYDPEGYELVRATFNLRPEQDWRYTFLQKLPNVTAPPAKLGIDPYYTKFTWAREFTVVGRAASDRALLAANDVIRKMFAYRHDVLKALIADGVRLAVLGRGERLADLPECKGAAGLDPRARALDYRPDTKLVAVPEEDAGRAVVGAFARALYVVAGTRPVDPGWESRPRSVWQQYELRVKRLDAGFDAAVKELHRKALAAGRWKGTADAAAYWTAGVLGYFDAAGRGPAATREALREYDPDLHALVEETMAYRGKVPWRFKPARP